MKRLQQWFLTTIVGAVALGVAVNRLDNALDDAPLAIRLLISLLGGQSVWVLALLGAVGGAMFTVGLVAMVLDAHQAPLPDGSFLPTRVAPALMAIARAIQVQESALEADKLFEVDLERAEEAYRQVLGLLEASPDVRTQAVIHCKMANIYTLQGRLPQAEACYNAALTLVQTDHDSETYAGILLGQGEWFYSQRRFHEARKKYLDAMKIYKEQENTLGQALCLKGLGDIGAYQCDWSQASEHYKDARSHSSPSGTPRLDGWLRLAEGDMHHALEQWEPACQAYKEGLALLEATCTQGTIWCLIGLANIHERLGLREEAIGSCEKAMEKSRQWKYEFGEAAALVTYGVIRAGLEEFQEATSLLNGALRLAGRLNEAKLCARAHRGLAFIQERQGQLEDAVQTLERAHKAYANAHDQLGCARVIADMGDVRLAQNLFPLAKAAYEDAIAIFRNLNHAYGVAVVTKDQGWLLWQMGQPVQALGKLGEASRKFAQMNDHYYEATVSWMMGEVYSGIGQVENARQAYARAEGYYQKISGSHVAFAMESLGEIALRTGDLDEANERLGKALQAFGQGSVRVSQARVLRTRATLAIIQGRWDQADKDLEQAFQIACVANSGGGQGLTLLVQGQRLTRMGLYRDAYGRLEEANPLISRYGSPTDRGSLGVAYGDLLYQMDHYGRAQVNYDRAENEYSKAQYPLGVAECKRGKGDVRLRLGDAAQAAQLFEEALAIFRQFQDAVGTASTLLSQGRLQAAAKSYESALDQYRTAFALYDQMGDPVGRASAKWAEACLWTGRKDWTTAFTIAEEAAHLFGNIGHRLGYARCQVTMAESLVGMRKLSTAEKLLVQAGDILEGHRFDFARLTELQGRISLRRRQRPKGLTHLRRARRCFDDIELTVVADALWREIHQLESKR